MRVRAESGKRWTLVAVSLGLLILVTASFASLDLQWSGLTEPGALTRMGDFLKGFSPPDTSAAFLSRVAWATLQTIAISLLSTVLATFLAAILALPASRAGTTGRVVVRSILNFLRAVPELIWAAIFVIAVGLGPFAGTLALAAHTTGVLGRLFGDTLENLPQASVRALQDNGVGPTARFLYATLPEALPQYMTYALYRWENNIRAATILGIVGAGGLGQLLFYYLSLFQMNRASTVILAMIGIVLVVDRLSYEARRWMTR